MEEIILSVMSEWDAPLFFPSQQLDDFCKNVNDIRGPPVSE